MANSKKKFQRFIIKSARNYFSTAKPKSFVEGHRRKILDVGWNVLGHTAATASEDKTARIWVLDSARNLLSSLELRGHEDKVNKIHWSPTSKDTIATASDDSTVIIWDTRTGKQSHTIKTKGANRNLAWSHDNKTIGIGTSMGNKTEILSFVDTRKAPEIMSEKKLEMEINQFAWNHSGDNLFLCNSRGGVDIYSYPSFKKMRTLEAHTNSCHFVEVDPSGKYIATGGADSFVTIWDLEELICTQTFDSMESRIKGISFSHNGQFIASASEDSKIEISDKDKGVHICSVDIGAEVEAIAWSPKTLIFAVVGEQKDRPYFSVFGR